MRSLIIAALLFSTMAGFTQTLAEQEDSLQLYMNQLGSATSDEDRLEASNSLEKMASRVLRRDSAFTYPFDGLKKISTIASKDGRVRLFNWHVPLQGKEPEYRAFVMVKKRKNRPHKLIRLVDSTTLSHDSEKSQLFPNEWYGAVYYEIQQLKSSGRDYYLVLGWDGHNGVSTKKVLDVIYLRGDDIRVGAPLLIKEGETLYRDVFEYTNDATMLLRYFPDRESIVFDHLAPLPDGVAGKHAFYAPSLSFDAYKATGKGALEFERNIEFTRPKELSNPEFTEPEPPDFDRERSKINPLTGEPIR